MFDYSGLDYYTQPDTSEYYMIGVNIKTLYGTAFDKCINLTNCSAEVKNSNFLNNMCGFFQCKNLTNCKCVIDETRTDSNSFPMCFELCNNLNDCSCVININFIPDKKS